jgi:transposase
MNTSKKLVKLADIEVQSRSMGHLGLISTYFEELGLKKFFDDLIPKKRTHKVSHGTAILAFLLNGLSFTRRQLYLFPEFFRNLPVSRLFGEGIEPEHLNDAVMGELLDKIYDFGPTELFGRLVSHILSREKLNLSRLHADTTNFSVHGEYAAIPAELSPEKPVMEVTIGHPKDGRWDLKRFVLSLIVNADGIPLFMKTHSGNASDHQTIMEAIDHVYTSLKEIDFDEAAYFIADAAFYTEKNIREFHGNWVSRAPATIEEVHMLLRSDVTLVTDIEDKRYAFHELTANYAGVEQKWVLVESEEMTTKMKKTFDMRLSKQLIAGQKSLVHLKNKKFACEADAMVYAAEWSKKYPLLCLSKIHVKVRHRRAPGLRGRPKKEENLTDVYVIEADLKVNFEAVAVEEKRLGRFVLATNDMTMSGYEILSVYKDQMHVERGFHFLKNKSFLVSETYVKKPQRIEALSFIMVLCLMVYSLLEYRLRQGLEKQNKTIPNRLGKPTARPTLQWAFSFFSAIAEARLLVAGIVMNVSLTQPHDKVSISTILSVFGRAYEKCYSGTYT